MPAVRPAKKGSAKTARVNSSQQKKPMPQDEDWSEDDHGGALREIKVERSRLPPPPRRLPSIDEGDKGGSGKSLVGFLPPLV